MITKVKEYNDYYVLEVSNNLSARFLWHTRAQIAEFKEDSTIFKLSKNMAKEIISRKPLGDNLTEMFRKLEDAIDDSYVVVVQIRTLLDDAYLLYKNNYTNQCESKLVEIQNLCPDSDKLTKVTLPEALLRIRVTLRIAEINLSLRRPIGDLLKRIYTLIESVQ